MKPFNKLSEAEKYKLLKVGLLWELYPEALPNKTAPDSETDYAPIPELPDNPEMVAFLDEVENGDYSPQQFDKDIEAIARSWEGERTYQYFCDAVQRNGGVLRIA